ncbi:MAG: bifunctional riboflavin kinase/FAD synthetase [Bacteroidota bacterium]
MNVFTDISDIQRKKNTVITIGTFDGLHLGHMAIIERLKHLSNARGGRSLVITFDPHPRSVVNTSEDFRLLTTTREKIGLFGSSGVENLLILKFTREFAQLTSEEFFRTVIAGKIGISELVIGYDHRLGRNRDGDESKLRQLGHIYSFGVEPVFAVNVDGETVSSTKIRHALLEGNVAKASGFLGRHYEISGKVVPGARRGRTLGFPTANIQPGDKTKLIPANGIYLVEFVIHPDGGNTQQTEESFYGLMNIGLRPTFADVTEQVIEVYLLDFEGDIYGREVTVKLLEYMRPEIKFASVQELVLKMQNDTADARQLIFQRFRKD